MTTGPRCAVVRVPAPSSAADFTLTHLDRRPVDVRLLSEQHRAFRRALEDAGVEVRVLPPLPGRPDSVFVEDTAVILPRRGDAPAAEADWLVVLGRSAVAARRDEVDTVAEALAPWGSLASIEPPGHLDGGDVLRVGGRLFVGLSSRTDEAGMEQLGRIARPAGYEVVPVPVSGALHLKTACTLAFPGTLVANPAWVEPAVFGVRRVVEVAPDEPFAANVLALDRGLIASASWPKTAARLRAAGADVRPVPLSEVEKAEGGPTCLVLLR